MSYEGNVAGMQDRAFAEQMVNKYLDMVGMGTSGLGQMGAEQLGRQQSAGNLGSWLSNFIENAQQGRMGIGMNLTGMQQDPLMALLGMSQQQRMKPKKSEMALAGLGQMLPFGISAMTGGMGGGGGGFSPWENWSIPTGGR